MEPNTRVCIVETNTHRQTSCVWTGATTVAEVIDAMNKVTAFSAVQPADFLDLNNNFNPDDFSDDNGEIDWEKVKDWENSFPIEAHFKAAIDCAAYDGSTVRVYLTREDAEEAGAPRYMSDDVYKQKIDLIFQ